MVGAPGRCQLHATRVCSSSLFALPSRLLLPPPELTPDLAARQLTCVHRRPHLAGPRLRCVCAVVAAFAAGAGAAGAAPAVVTFEADDMVQVTERPFKGLQGPMYASATGDADGGGGGAERRRRRRGRRRRLADGGAEMVRVALSIMGRETAVELPARHLVRLPRGARGGRRGRTPLHLTASRTRSFIIVRYFELGDLSE